jgi:PAS domain S-box-containing protein
VELRDDPLTAVALPESVLHYVLRTNESVILDDAAARSPFADDPYIRERQARSVLCLPLVSQAKLTGVLYLENNLTRSVFTPDRTALLKLLASQAAISLKNAQLYRELAEREARLVERTEELRRSETYLAEAERLSHTGTWAVSVKGEKTIVYWSEESYRGYGLDPLQGLPTLDGVWQQVHPQDRSRLHEAIQEAERQKRDYLVEFRLLLPDGELKYLEAIGHHVFSPDGELLEVIGTHVDVTERKRTEQAVRESEDRLRQIAETVPGLLWSNGPDGEPTHINQRMLDLSRRRRRCDRNHARTGGA